MMKKKHLPLLVLSLAVVVLLSACSGALSSSSWPGLSVDQNNAYVAAGPYVYAVSLNNGSMVWRFPEKAGKGFYAPPAMTSDGQLIEGGYDNLLYSINPQNGTQNWTFNGNGKTDKWIAGVLTSGQDIYAPNSNKAFYDLDLKGNQKWVYYADNALWAAPVEDDKNLYLPSMDHNLYAINKSTGQMVWKTDLGGAIAGRPTLSKDGTLYVGTMGNEIVAVKASDGSIAWRFSTTGGVWTGPTLQGNTLYFGDLKGTFYGVDITTQKAVFQMTPDGPIVSQPLILNNNEIVFGTEAGTVTAVDSTGKVLWNHAINGKLYTTPVLAGNRIMVAVTQGDVLLVALDQNGNQVWSFQPPK